MKSALYVVLFSLFATFAEADPPSLVGRISYTNGAVSMYTERDDGWKAAQLNYPITSENSLWTSADGRAEVHIGANALRLEQNSVLDFILIDENHIVTLLQRGAINIRVGQLESADRFRIDNPHGRLTLQSNGRYHIEFNDEASRLTALSGRAIWDSSDAPKTIENGKTLVVHNNQRDNYFQPATETALDKWAAARDSQWDSINSRYARDDVISPTMTGYEDLDANGDWSVDAEYGRVWMPRVASATWVPYRDGHWAWVTPWGWTWIDNAAWGFAPFHYGRWVMVRERWAWWPGSYRYRPVYAPALVAWNGSIGAGLGVGMGATIGWFPLAPYEPFFPSYTSNVTYLQNVNRIYNNRPFSVVAPGRYRHQVPGITIVEQNTFIHSRPVNGGNSQTVPGGNQQRSYGANYLPRPPRGQEPRIANVPPAYRNNPATVVTPNAAPVVPGSSMPTQMPSRRYDGNRPANNDTPASRLPNPAATDTRLPNAHSPEVRTDSPKPLPRRTESDKRAPPDTAREISAEGRREQPGQNGSGIKREGLDPAVTESLPAARPPVAASAEGNNRSARGRRPDLEAAK